MNSFTYTLRYLWYAAVSILTAWVCFACKQSAPSVYTSGIPDTLRVGTLYGPTSYFLYRDQPMGYEYELMQKVLEENGVGMKIEVAPGMDSLIAMLNDNRIDVIAFEVPYTAQYNDRVLHCGNENITYQVLVQPTSDNPIREATDLVGKEVWVIENSKYEHRLRNLNNEVGGGIIIRTVPQDSIIADDLIEMVSNGTIPFTVIDGDKARINRTYYPNIDIGTRLGFPQRSSWAVKNGNTELADSLTS
ncbi:MAG: transporter substrate-binding domain-containing protein, partial [Muribaculaceae bacterium]|nr:transporter substrate-binding domain-containing protein [Muribaculaceae bacterium]